MKRLHVVLVTAWGLLVAAIWAALVLEFSPPELSTHTGHLLAPVLDGFDWPRHVED